MKILELATELETNEKEIQEALKILGLSWDEKGNIRPRSQVFGQDVRVEQLLVQVSEIQQQSKTSTLAEAARVLVEMYKAQAFQQKQEAKGIQFELDAYFEETFGIAPSQLVPGSATHLIYRNLQRYQGTGVHLVAAIFGYVQAEADAILNGKKNLQETDLEVIEQTIALGIDQGASGVENCFQRGLNNIHTKAILRAEEVKGAMPAAVSQNSISGLLPN